jgi:hypothetical protein
MKVTGLKSPMKTYEWTAKSHVNIHDVMFFAAFSIFCLDSLVFMAINHGLIMSLVEQFLVGNLAEELEELNKLIAQQREILSWNVSNNPGKPWIALNLIQRLDGLESQKMQLVGWQEELLWTEASLNSILRQ